jgi:5-methylcytosine-specific restriction protein A
MTGGGNLETEVWAEFGHDRERLNNVANSIRKIITGSRDINGADVDDVEAPEGRLLSQYHRSRERARGLVLRKKEHAIRSGKALACEVCDFCFATQYGERGVGFIECHHRQPLSSLSPGTPTKVADLALVCSNCHSMLHRGNPWPSVEELRRALGRGAVH